MESRGGLSGLRDRYNTTDCCVNNTHTSVWMWFPPPRRFCVIQITNPCPLSCPLQQEKGRREAKVQQHEGCQGGVRIINRQNARTSTEGEGMLRANDLNHFFQQVQPGHLTPLSTLFFPYIYSEWQNLSSFNGLDFTSTEAAKQKPPTLWKTS